MHTKSDVSRDAEKVSAASNVVGDAAAEQNQGEENEEEENQEEEEEDEEEEEEENTDDEDDVSCPDRRIDNLKSKYHLSVKTYSRSHSCVVPFPTKKCQTLQIEETASSS